MIHAWERPTDNGVVGNSYHFAVFTNDFDIVTINADQVEDINQEVILETSLHRHSKGIGREVVNLTTNF